MMVWTYVTYVAVSLAATIWVGRSLHGNGRVFLVENFHGRERLADSVNHLLLVGLRFRESSFWGRMASEVRTA